MPSESPRDTGAHIGDLSSTRASRRVVLKAVAGLSALAASGISAVPTAQQRAQAQDTGGTRATRFVPSDSGINADDAAAGEWISFQADYPFWALGASWDAATGEWPVIVMQLSADGATWTETIRAAANTEEGVSNTDTERLFTSLVFTDGAQWVRYQTVDADGVSGSVDGLTFVYIDPTDGPWADDIESGAPSSESRFSISSQETIAPPEIITRAQWGANEAWRFDQYGEVDPPMYETVSHIIIHHTATQNNPVDVPGAIRSIYYYHAIELGWGDIGYNYLVDHLGRIYQGRYGGQNVVGHHAYQFAYGSAGISTIGNYMTVEPSDAAKSALVSICAWAARDLDPLGRSGFHEIPQLPTISSHRDVTLSACPGDLLWNDLPQIRQLVAETIASGVLDTGLPAGLVPGDRVKVQTDDGSDIIVRQTVGGTVIGSLPQGSNAWVTDGPNITDTGNWYQIRAESNSLTGWVTPVYLIVDPPFPPGSPDGTLPFGLNVRVVDDVVNLRRSPDTTAGVIAGVARDTWGFILAGPVINDGWKWYEVHFQAIGDGWVISDAIASAPIDTSPTAKYTVGDTVIASAPTAVHPRPGIAQTVISTAPTGSSFLITEPAIEVTGVVWYGVYSQTYGGVWVAESTLRSSVTPPPTPKFAVNDTIKVTSSTNLRATPSTSGSVLVTMATGTIATVIDGPRTASGYTWWNVRIANGTSGWCIENWLVKTDVTTPPPDSTKFKVNDTFKVLETTNLRSSAMTSAGVVTTMSVGTTGTVIGGPTAANGYNWWQVRLTSGTSGWCIENWLQKTDVTTPPPGSTKFKVNDTFRVSDTMNMRSAASTSASVVASLPTGTTGTVIGGPTAANGYNWWHLRTSGGTSGWAVENWLANTTGTTTPPPTGNFAIGDAVHVTERANLRSAAGTSASVVRGVAVGETATIKAGPTSASGYTWWQVQFSGGTGWIIEDVLAKGTTTPPPTGNFAIGDAVHVTERANLRSAAGTSASVVRGVAVGETATIKAGPTLASGYTWWQVQFSGGSGWIIEDVLARGGTTPPPSDGSFPAGTAVKTTTSNLRMRASASTSGTVLYALPLGTRLTIVSGPVTGSGYTWYEVQSSTYGTGFVVKDYIAKV